MPRDGFDLPFSSAEEDPDPVDKSPIEPGNPSPENVLFLLLGVLVALVVVARLFVLFG